MGMGFSTLLAQILEDVISIFFNSDITTERAATLTSNAIIYYSIAITIVAVSYISWVWLEKNAR